MNFLWIIFIFQIIYFWPIQIFKPFLLEQKKVKVEFKLELDNIHPGEHTMCFQIVNAIDQDNIVSAKVKTLVVTEIIEIR